MFLRCENFDWRKLKWSKVFGVAIEMIEMARSFGWCGVEMWKWRGVFRVFKREECEDRKGAGKGNAEECVLFTLDRSGLFGRVWSARGALGQRRPCILFSVWSSK